MNDALRPFARSGLLIATLAGAALGTVAARAFESAIGGADPEFVALLGAAFGGILGRSVWTRVRQARQVRRSIAGPLLLLAVRIVLCVLLAIALIGPSAAQSAGMTPVVRVSVAIVSLFLFAILAMMEYRWLRQASAAAPGAGGSHVD